MHFPYDPAQIDAVVFDIGGVFCIRDGELITAGLAAAGLVVEADEHRYHRAHFEAVAALAERLDDDRASALHEHDPDFWVHFERAYLGHIGIAEADIDRAITAVRVEVYEKMAKPIWRYRLVDNIESFHRLAASGMPVAIVSNNDGTAEKQLLEFGVCQIGAGALPSVAAVVDSGVLGIAKPDPRIFAPALDALGTEPGRTLYVGDTVHADVIGAGNAGMPVVQLDPYDLHARYGHARLADVAALVDLLLA